MDAAMLPVPARVPKRQAVIGGILTPSAPTFSVGQRVTFLPNNPTSLEDILGADTEGLFQHYLLIPQPALERGMVILCDPHLPLICGPLLEPFATVLYGQRLVEQVCEPQSMVVVGAGAIGWLNVLSARAHGCAQIFLVDRSQARLDWAVKRGIVDASSALVTSLELTERLVERMAGQGVDVVYICTPRAATRSVLEQALQFVREDGCINLTSGTDGRGALPQLPGVDLNSLRHANVCGLGHHMTRCVTQEGKRLWLTGHSGASASDMHKAMDLLLADPTTYAKVISHVVSYQAVPRIVEVLLAPEAPQMSVAPYVKVIIDLTAEDLRIEEVDLLHESFCVSNPACSQPK